MRATIFWQVTKPLVALVNLAEAVIAVSTAGFWWPGWTIPFLVWRSDIMFHLQEKQ